MEFAVRQDRPQDEVRDQSDHEDPCDGEDRADQGHVPAVPLCDPGADAAELPIRVGPHELLLRGHRPHPSQSNRSMIVAWAWPPPSHIVWNPKPLPVRSSSWRSVTVILAPVAPTGWPSEMPPPFTFTLSSGTSNSRCHIGMIEPIASLHSNRSISSTPMPVFAKIFRVTGTGALSITTGVVPAMANA